MSRKSLRRILTVLMYAGVVIFIFPYLSGKVMSGIWLMILGALMAVVCGLLRCYLTEGDCGRVSDVGRDW